MKRITTILVSLLIMIGCINIFTIVSLSYTGEKYSIQVGMFKKIANAERIQNMLTKYGFPTYKIQGDYTRVYVGNYKSKTEAQSVLNEIENLGVNGFIKAEPIILGEDIYLQTQDDNNLAKVKNFRFNNDVNIQGVFGSYTFFFDVGDYWDVNEGSYIELVLSQSDIKEYKNSTLTIEINGIPIYSTLLYSKKVSKEKLKVFIPKDRILQGFNEIEIRTYHRITDEPCTDEINPGNWIVFHKESYVHLKYKEKQDSMRLDEYPYPYLKEGNDNPINNVILVSDYFFSDELTAAMVLSGNFGQRQRFDNLNIRIYKFSEAEDIDKNNIIFIGSVKNTPEKILSFLSNEELKATEDKAVIKEVVSPYNKQKKMLLILSQRSDKLIEAAKALSKDSLVKQMNKDVQIISKIENFQKDEEEVDNYIFLQELGYPNVTMEGIFYQEASFDINIPKNWQIKEEAKIILNMRYSEILNFDRSLVTVYINDIPIGSKKLTSMGANNDIFEVEIPHEVRENNVYNIRIVYYLELQGSEYCDFKRQDSSWVFISNKSHLYLPHIDKKQNYFENYTSPLIKDRKLSDILMILSDDSTSRELSIAGNIIGFLGHEAEYIEDIKFKTASEFKDENNDKNIIAIGTPDRNSFIKAINDSLHIKFNHDFSRFLSNDKISILEDYSKRLASIQLIESPFSEDKKLLIVTATIERGLEWAEKYLSDYALIAQLRGNGIIIDESGNLIWDYFGEDLKEKSNQPEVEKNIDKKIDVGEILRSDIRNYILFIIITIIIIIISSIFIIRRNKRL
ncbi:MAG: hypothetical protein PWQ37_2534 [Candidatus Petromonas sp.]|nr:hypothetical protein [Candidatus Petromonas sp.]